MRKIFKVVSTLAFLTLVTGVSGCGKSSDVVTDSSVVADEATAGGLSLDTKNFVVTAVKSDIETADVHKTTRDYMVPLNIYDRLVEFKVENNSSEIVPSLAEKWDISEDGLKYTFKLREGVKFHNGEEFKSDDVVYSLTRIMSVKGAVNGGFMDRILGADALMEGTATELEGVKAIDDYTVEITLQNPYAGFLSCLASSPVCMMDKKSTEEAGDDFGIKPELTVGTGPYKFVKWEQNNAVYLQKNEEYWGKKAENDGVIIKVVPDTETQNMLYKGGELDILDMDSLIEYIPEYKESYKDNLTSTPRVGVTYFTLNQNIKPLDDVNVRRAIGMAINRQDLVDYIYGGIARLEEGIFPTGLIGHNNNPVKLEYNPEKAKELLKEAGYENGFDMEIALDSASTDTTVASVENIAEQLKQIGINASIKKYDHAVWLSTRNAGELGSYLSIWTADYNDPDNFIYTFFGNEENTKLRSLNYKDKEVMQRVTDARSIIDQDKRMEEYKELEKKIVADDMAWVPMFSREHYFALSDRISGFVPNWAGISDISFSSISIKE